MTTIQAESLKNSSLAVYDKTITFDGEGLSQVEDELAVSLANLKGITILRAPADVEDAITQARSHHKTALAKKPGGFVTGMVSPGGTNVLGTSSQAPKTSNVSAVGGRIAAGVKTASSPGGVAGPAPKAEFAKEAAPESAVAKAFEEEAPAEEKKGFFSSKKDKKLKPKR